MCAHDVLGRPHAGVRPEYYFTMKTGIGLTCFMEAQRWSRTCNSMSTVISYFSKFSSKLKSNFVVSVFHEKSIDEINLPPTNTRHTDDHIHFCCMYGNSDDVRALPTDEDDDQHTVMTLFQIFQISKNTCHDDHNDFRVLLSKLKEIRDTYCHSNRYFNKHNRNISLSSL